MSYTGRYSRYALTDILICGECGTKYRRCTWVRSGYKKVVWRCVSRLDYGTKYCTDSCTADEGALHAAIVRAIKKFNEENGQTYNALMKATIADALGINGTDDEIQLLEQRINALNKRMLEVVSESVKNGGSIDDCEAKCKDLNDQIKLLKGRIEAIEKHMVKNSDYREKLKMIEEEIDNRKAYIDIYNDTVVRQIIECVKIFADGRLEVYFGGGNMVEEHI